MFSGIIEKKAKIRRISGSPTEQIEIEIDTGFADLVLGESVAVNGVCLTAAELTQTGNALFYVSPETLQKTQLGTLSENTFVNLERALKVSDRLSGHIVQGHVDGLGTVVAIQNVNDSVQLRIKLPQNLLRYCIDKGSITINGISLTINSLDDLSSTIDLMIIPHTWKITTLSSLKVQDTVNIENDVLAKYMERLCQPKNL